MCYTVGELVHVGAPTQMATMAAYEIESPYMRLQKAVLTSKRQELREKLNLHAIYPHLYTHGLLPVTLARVELLDLSPKMAQVDRLITYVPMCGKLNFLDEFIVCLEESKEGTGGAHEELIDSLQAAYKSAMDSRWKFMSSYPQNGI